jgi:hypothetical protein
MGLLLVDVFLGWGRLVFNSLWTFTLIWVPLIVVPDSSPRACGGVGILLQRLYVGYAICQALAKLLRPWLVFGLLFFRGCTRAHPPGVAPEPVEELVYSFRGCTLVMSRVGLCWVSHHRLVFGCLFLGVHVSAPGGCSPRGLRRIGYASKVLFLHGL